MASPFSYSRQPFDRIHYPISNYRPSQTTTIHPQSNDGRAELHGQFRRASSTGHCRTEHSQSRRSPSSILGRISTFLKSTAQFSAYERAGRRRSGNALFDYSRFQGCISAIPGHKHSRNPRFRNEFSHRFQTLHERLALPHELQ